MKMKNARSIMRPFALPMMTRPVASKYQSDFVLKDAPLKKEIWSVKGTNLFSVNHYTSNISEASIQLQGKFLKSNVISFQELSARKSPSLFQSLLKR